MDHGFREWRNIGKKKFKAKKTISISKYYKRRTLES